MATIYKTLLIYSQGYLCVALGAGHFSHTFLMCPATSFETSGPKRGFSCARKAINQLAEMSRNLAHVSLALFQGFSMRK